MNLNVSLTDELVRFVRTKVETGRYASSSEVVREALRLLERQDQDEAERRAWLQQAWRDGISSGDFQEIDFGKFRREMRDKLDARKV